MFCKTRVEEASLEREEGDEGHFLVRSETKREQGRSAAGAGPRPLSLRARWIDLARLPTRVIVAILSDPFVFHTSVSELRKGLQVYRQLYLMRLILI